MLNQYLMKEDKLIILNILFGMNSVSLCSIWFGISDLVVLKILF